MIACRKMMRFQLAYASNRVSFGIADMQEAFIKWRDNEGKICNSLFKQSYGYLLAQNNKQSNDLIRMANQEVDNIDLIKDLRTQRDTLLEHYIHGQKLGLIALHDRRTIATRKPFKIWLEVLKNTKRAESTQQLIVGVE